jgi:hypothetical protein
LGFFFLYFVVFASFFVCFFFFDQNKTRIKNIHWFGAEGNRIYLINELIVGLLLGCISISGAEEDENEKQYKKPPLKQNEQLEIHFNFNTYIPSLFSK